LSKIGQTVAAVKHTSDKRASKDEEDIGDDRSNKLRTSKERGVGKGKEADRGLNDG
jgi:hypothetical protein